MCDRKRGYGGHIDLVNLPYAASFGYYANMVQQIEFIKRDNLENNYCISPNFLCEITHEYGVDLIRFSAFHL